MVSQRLSENQIKISILPRRVRWAEPNTAAAWAKAHYCVDALQELVRNVDVECQQVEQNNEFSSDTIRKRRAAICDAALSKLSNFRPLEVAEKALAENVAALERLSNRNQGQVEMHTTLKRALHELPEGVEATKRMVQDGARRASARWFDRQAPLNEASLGRCLAGSRGVQWKSPFEGQSNVGSEAGHYAFEPKARD
jgi:hypothetical protein